MNILVATDFSSRSDRAVRRATLLARTHEAELSLVHVIDDDRPRRVVRSDQDHATALLEEQARSLREVDGVKSGYRIVLGVPFEGIVKAGDETAADLLVIGPHRQSALRDVFVGTTAERTIRTSRRPVLMVSGVPAAPYKHILVAVDLSDGSADAVRAVTGLGLAKGAAVSVIHFFDAPGTALLKRTVSDRDEVSDYVEGEETRAAGELSSFLGGLELAPTRRIVKLAETSVAFGISEAARDVAADLVVVGTRGRTGLAKMLIGSVAEELLRIATCDVLAVPPRQRD